MWKPFETLFTVRKKSLYAEQWSFQTVNQHRALCITADEDLKQEIEDQYGLFIENPLHLENVFFAGVELMS